MIKIEIQKFVESKYAMPKTIHWCFFPVSIPSLLPSSLTFCQKRKSPINSMCTKKEFNNFNLLPTIRKDKKEIP